MQSDLQKFRRKDTSTYYRQRVRFGLGLALMVLACFGVSAQETTTIDEVVVTGTADYFSIIPNEESEGAFGLSKSLLETPRSITTVSEDLIEKFALRSVDDMVRLTPGAFTSSFFGIRGAMDIRGEPADNYYRGFKRIANPGAFNTIVRGAEKLEVYRGPVSPLYGSGSVGGQLNYIPKSAKVDGDVFVSGIGGSVDLTLGSYNQKILSADFGMPFQIAGYEAGIHIFAEVEDSESFFDGYEPSSDLVQIAFDMNISDATRVEFGGQYQTSDSIQVPGWNRITQDLIDNGTYITGAPQQLNSTNPIGIESLWPQESSFIAPFAPDFLNNAFSNTGSFCSGAAAGTGNATYRGNEVSCPGAFGSFLSDRTLDNPFALTNVGTTQLDHETTFIDDIDYADSTAITLYFDVTHELDNGSVWKNEAFYDYMDHTKYQSWGFTAYYPDATAIELRTSYKFDYSTDNLFAETIVGANYRYEDLELYHAFFDETFDFRDISVGPTPDDRISAAVFDPYENAEITYDLNGDPTGITGTVARNFNEVHFSTNENLGVFFLSDISVEKFSLLVGGRYDQFDVESEDGWVTYLGSERSTGVISGSESAFSYNLSGSYLSDSGVAPYVTYSESNSLSANQLGGIIPGTIDSGEYLQGSTLSEIGIKFDGFDGMIYSAISYFDQEKSFRDGQTGALIEVAGKGLEFELRALVTDNLSILATATSSETTEVSDGALAVINGAEFAIENGLSPDEVFGGRIAGSRSAFLGSGVELNRGGLPDNIFSLYGTWNQPLGDADLTGSLGFTWVEETYTDAFETILLPEYMVWTASTSYLSGPFTALLQVNNLFDEDYYTSADLFDSVVVKPSEGRTLSLTLSYAFGD